MVAVGADRICVEHPDLGFGGAGLVEDSGLVVSGVRRSFTAQVRGDYCSARLTLPGVVLYGKPPVRRRLVQSSHLPCRTPRCCFYRKISSLTREESNSASMFIMRVYTTRLRGFTTQQGATTSARRNSIQTAIG